MLDHVDNWYNKFNYKSIDLQELSKKNIPCKTGLRRC